MTKQNIRKLKLLVNYHKYLNDKLEEARASGDRFIATATIEQLQNWRAELQNEKPQ